MKKNIVVFHPARTDKAENNVGHALSILRDEYQFDNVQPERIASSKEEEFMGIINQSENQLMMAWMGGKVDTENAFTEKEKINEMGSSIQLVKALSKKDWDIIEKQRPVIIGSSDITYLLNELQNHDIECYYGPNFKSTLVDTCDSQREVTVKYLKMALESKNEYCIKWAEAELNPEGIKPWILSTGIATGRLVGGNLATLAYLCEHYHKHWVIPEKAEIIFLEDIDPLYFIDDGHVKNSQKGVFKKIIENGYFDNIKGLIIGRSKRPIQIGTIEDDRLPERASYEQEHSYIIDIITELIENDIPILGNVSCGHTHPMVTLPLGRTVTLDAYKQTLVVHPK